MNEVNEQQAPNLEEMDEREAGLADRLTPQPIRIFEQPVRLANPATTPPRAYVHCAAGPLAPSFAPFAERPRAAPGWTCRELATGHDAMLTAPEELAEALLELARTNA